MRHLRRTAGSDRPARSIAAKADLVLLSNTDPLHLEYVRSHYDFLHKFGRMLLSYEVGYAKPAKQIFERAVGLVAPGTRMIYFDDVPEFVSAARACGLPAEQFVDAAKLRTPPKGFRGAISALLSP